MAAEQRGKDKQNEVSRIQDWSVLPCAHLLSSLSVKENNEAKERRGLSHAF